MSLVEHHVACYEAFQRACAISDGGEPSELPDQFDRYKLWAGNVGAAHSGPTYTLSLDYRLREASFYKEQVARLLVILCRHLNKAAQLLSGERTPFEAFPSDRRLENADFSPDGAIIPSPEADDSSWEISSDSESDASFHPPPQRYQSSQPATGEEDTELVADSTSSEGLQELPQTLESIKLTVASLFKLPIRRPAPVDRLNDRATDETSCFQPFDAMYIKDKFQGLEEQLATRLGSMITQRRQLLLYRKRHWQHLRTDYTERSSTVHHHHANEEHGCPQRSIENGDDTGSVMRSSTREESRHDTSRIITTSKATTLNINNGPRLHLDLEHLSVPPIGQSVTETSIQASEHTRQLRLNVPPRPKDPFGAPKDCFQCPYCHLVQVISSERTWRKHVLADLQPYVCTFPHCNLSDHFFETREAWYEHETENHRVELFCNTAGHPSYTNQPDFEEHIRMDHGADMAANLPTSLFGMFKRPLRASEMTCNLCFRKTKSLKSHVARHLEQISLFAVPRADYSHSDEDLNQGSNVAQDNAQESDIEDLDVDDAQIRSTWDTDSQASKLDEVPPSGKGTEHVMPVWESLELEHPEVPDTEEFTWDTVTDRFAQARSGLAEAAPLGLVPAGADQKLSSNLNGQPTPRTRFQEAIKAIITLHRHRKMKRTRGGMQMTNMIIIDATAGHPSQKESVERMKELGIMFAQRFADYRPILRVVDKDTGILRLEVVEEAIQDFLRSHHGPERMLAIFIIGPPEAAVEVMQTSNTRRSLAEILFKFICREVEGKGANISVILDSGNPWADPTAAAEPIFKMEADATKGLDEAEWTFPMVVACRPESSTPMSQAAPFTASAVSAIFKLIEKGRTYMIQDFLEATIAELPKGEKIIWLGPDRERLAYTCQFTPRTLRTASLNLPSSQSAHITILLVNLACTAWLLALYRRRLSRYTPISRLMTTEPIGETANASPAISPLISTEVATLAFQKWRLISRIRRLKERLLQTRVLFLWRMSLANGSASDTRVPGVGAAVGSYSGEDKASYYPQGRNSTASRADVDFTVPLAEKAVARVVEQGFSTSEAEFALVHTRSQDGQFSVERAWEFLNGLP